MTSEHSHSFPIGSEPLESPILSPDIHLDAQRRHPSQRLSSAAQSVEALARLLVDRPAQVRVHELIGQSSHLLELQTCRADYGKLIGQRGATASRLRHLLSAMSGRVHRRFLLELLEPDAASDTPSNPPPAFPPPAEAIAPEPAPAHASKPTAAPDPTPEIVAALHLTLCQLVSRPQSVKIDVVTATHMVVLEVSVHPSDIKWVLGKGGEHIEALRGLLTCMGAKHERRYSLLCHDPARSGG